MQFKPFFVHHQVPHYALKQPSSRRRGFTAFVSPGPDRTINVQVAFCGKKDEFVKKLGREQALSSKSVNINARHLASFLEDAAMEVGYFKEYTYLYKYLF